MNRTLKIEPEAEADLAEAFCWYESQRMGLGQQLLLAVEARMAAIRRRPESFRLIRRGVRRALVRRFPYGIFFIVEQRSIHVVAVLHAKRKPTIWKKRIRR